MEQIAYCYNDDGYYTHSEYCTIDPLESEKQGRNVYVMPANSLSKAPVIAEGCVAKCVDEDWVNEENHVGESGYVNGVPTEIKEYGPLPDGWSDTPPPLTTEELFFRIRGQRDARINSVLWMSERHSDELALGKETSLSQEQYTALLTYIQALRDLPAQPGAPWDGGGTETPWPELPKT